MLLRFDFLFLSLALLATTVLVALVLIASAGGDEFKLLEVIGNIVVLTILCVVVFKVGLSMNISVISGVW